MTDEESMVGGNRSQVSRAGSTVRRSAGPWSAQVQRLLAHLRASGIDQVPAPLGFDEQGREILSFIPGEAGNDPLPLGLRSDICLSQSAHLLRRIHDATAAVASAWSAGGWQLPARQPVEVICHGDFAPYNCIYQNGQLSGVIDFDYAHPAPRAWDIAYALYRFAPLSAPSNPDSYGSLPEQCRRAALFCREYGQARPALLTSWIQARLEGMAEMLREGAANGDARCQANIQAGHLDIYVNDLAYFMAHQHHFHAALEG